MTESGLFHILLIAFAALSAIIFTVLLFVIAPYGRHVRSGWGPKINATAGWVIMESPAVIVFGICFLIGDRIENLAAIIFFVMWQFHYVHRTLIFPFRMRPGGKQMPIIIMASGLFFNLVNGYLQGRYLFKLSEAYEIDWLINPRFVMGLLIFIAGIVMNFQSDGILRNLRKHGETGYKIPYGGLYKWISCPNYFGEIVEWTGWAAATWSLAGLIFALWTAANLVPRAIAHHCWYQQNFAEYPKSRKVIIPFIY